MKSEEITKTALDRPVALTDLLCHIFDQEKQMNKIYYRRYTTTNHFGQRDTKNVSIAFTPQEGYKELLEGEKIDFVVSHWKMDKEEIQILENRKGIPYKNERRVQCFETMDMVELSRRIDRERTDKRV